MTIHTDHPFAVPEPDRDPVRRLRGRLGRTVGLLTTESGSRGRSGLTVSSILVAPGEPGRVLALVDPDSDFASEVVDAGVAVLQLLSWRHRQLADAFAGQFPAPGGLFKLADWDETPWGPRLRDATTYAGLRLIGGEPRPVGWSVLLDSVIEEVAIGDEPEPLVSSRGRYVRPDAADAQD